MEDLNNVIADNLKEIRINRGLSLDNAASLTGVSKSMLGQIERGESNPTIATLWKIASGLKVSLSSLIQKPVEENKVIYKSELSAIIEDNGKYRIYPFFPFEEGRKFEMYQVVVSPDGELNAEAHNKDTLEMVVVFEGQLEITVEGSKFLLNKDDGFEFRGDKVHSYKNLGETETILSVIIYYPE
ncbi:MAG: XRE family transcriptional regulator [Eubacteriales bacterium]|nr:XRE family transcriptional regulator [Eubacteriales bacterium]